MKIEPRKKIYKMLIWNSLFDVSIGTIKGYHHVEKIENQYMHLFFHTEMRNSRKLRVEITLIIGNDKNLKKILGIKYKKYKNVQTGKIGLEGLGRASRYIDFFEGFILEEYPDHVIEMVIDGSNKKRENVYRRFLTRKDYVWNDRMRKMVKHLE